MEQQQEGYVEQGVEPQSQRVQISSPMSQYGPSLIALTNPESELYKIEMILKGIHVDAEGTMVQGEPLLNQRGVNKVMGLVSSTLNQVTFLSALDKNEAFGCYLCFLDGLDQMLMLNRTQFEIKYPESDRTTISSECVLRIFPGLTRGREGDDKRFLSRGGMIQELHTVGGSQQMNKRGGVMAALWPWGKQ